MDIVERLRKNGRLGPDRNDAADEIEKLRGLLLNITHHDGALKEFEPIWSPIVQAELARRLGVPNVKLRGCPIEKG